MYGVSNTVREALAVAGVPFAVTFEARWGTAGIMGCFACLADAQESARVLHAQMESGSVGNGGTVRAVDVRTLEVSWAAIVTIPAPLAPSASVRS